MRIVMNNGWRFFPFVKHGIDIFYISKFQTRGIVSFASIAKLSNKEFNIQKIENVSSDETLHLSAFIDQLLIQPIESISAKKNNLSNPINFQRQLMKASGYWNSLLQSDEVLSSENVNRFCKDLNGLDVKSVVFLLIYFGNERIRHENILEPLCRRIEEFFPLNNPILVGNILKSLLQLGWYDARLVTKLKHEILEFRDDIYSLKFPLGLLARFHLTDQHFWRQIIESLEPKLESKQIPILFLYHITQAFALTNVDCRLTFPFVQALIKNFSTNLTNDWLEFAYILTCLNSLNNSVAESVLNKNFVNAIKTDFKFKFEKERAYNNMRLKTISCAAKLELPNYKGPFFVDNLTAKEKRHLLKTKFTAEGMKAFSNFEILMRLVVLPNLYSTGQEWHEATGVIIEGRCFVDVSKREFIPLTKIQTEGKQGTTCKEIAILFFTERQLTKIYDPTEEIGPVRLVGVCQTGIRLLKKAGLHPVVFTEEQFQSFDDERTKVEYIRNKLLYLSEDFHENNWLLDKANVNNYDR
uniref:Uncharacterized protein n=1 Tax=Meloidogyne incognita TaxID=6306 RepID=A0A914LQE7_MELIC